VRRAVAAAGISLAWTLLPAQALAQRVEIRVPERPHFVDAPLDVRLIAEDFDAEPQPDISVADPQHGKLELVGVFPDIRTSIQIVNGRLSRSEQVRFVYRFRYVAATPGRVVLGPFTVTQGQVVRSTRPVALELQSVPTSDRLRVELILPGTPVYPGERVPLELQVWIESELRESLAGYALRVPLFDREESFRFLDPPVAGRTTEVEIQTLDGPKSLRARTREQRAGGRTFLVLSIARTLVPLRPGSFELEAPSLFADEAIRWQRDLFGRRRATATRKLRSEGRPARLEVQEVPQQGRPASYAGAVGQGFELDVRADRSVVTAGEPITLTLTLRGDGNLEGASLPPLDAPGLLPAADFRVPDGQLAGQIGESGKEFVATVRTRHEAVREIPALEFSWFDPRTHRFEKTHSQPIALSVGEAQRIGAADVVRAPTESGDPSDEAPPETRADGSGALVLTGADLAIERRPDRLLRRERLAGGPWAVAALHAAGLLLVALAVLDRRRRAVDPALVAQRRRLRAARQEVRAAAGRPAAEGAATLASGLRRMLAEVPGAQTAELESLLAECDARRFDPAETASVEALDPELHARALALALALEEAAE